MRIKWDHIYQLLSSVTEWYINTWYMWASGIILFPHVTACAWSRLSQLLPLLPTNSSCYSKVTPNLYLSALFQCISVNWVLTVGLQGSTGHRSPAILLLKTRSPCPERFAILLRVTQEEWKGQEGCPVFNHTLCVTNAISSTIKSNIHSISLPSQGHYSKHQWESISFCAWLIFIPRLTCSTFILCLPLSFTSSPSPESLFALCTSPLPLPPTRCPRPSQSALFLLAPDCPTVLRFQWTLLLDFGSRKACLPEISLWSMLKIEERGILK